MEVAETTVSCICEHLFSHLLKSFAQGTPRERCVHSFSALIVFSGSLACVVTQPPWAIAEAKGHIHYLAEKQKKTPKNVQSKPWTKMNERP
jgi:hypothetical protein